MPKCLRQGPKKSAVSCETDFLLASDNFHTAIKFHFVIVFRDARSD